MYADVIVHPFGEIDEALIGAVRQAVQQRFRVQVTIGERKRMPEYSYSQERGQYRSTRFLDELSKVGHDPQIRLGIATVDLFVPELNSSPKPVGRVFPTKGLASFHKRARIG